MITALVKYAVNGKEYEEEFTLFETSKQMQEIEINTELDSRFFGEQREILEIKPIL